MPLSKYEVGAAVAVSDMERAREFYEGRLGLTAPGGEQPDGGRRYACAAGTTIHVYPSPDGAGRSPATVAGWVVDDLQRVVDELTARGVVFERYDGPTLSTDERGIAVLGDSREAWFKDPDGNILAVGER
jgi:catechol 2,3-dioxygenase-like lactoylglutathione lyase family enzyme